MSDDMLQRRKPIIRGASTYTILLRGFAATVAMDGWPGRPEVRINLRLTVSHPGPGFPDNIAAVMSYEDIVEDLRRVCAQEILPSPDHLAERTAGLCLAHQEVLSAEVEVELPAVGAQGEQGTAVGAAVTRVQRSKS